MSHSDKWDKYERKLDASDIKAAEEDDEEKEEVKVVSEEKEDNMTFSGLYCVYCHDYAVHIYDGMSVCHQCYSKEVSELIKDKHKK